MEPTTKEEFQAGLSRYQGKCATRVAGPWSDIEPPMKKVSDVVHLESVGLLPWHITMNDMLAKPPDPRLIYCIVDRKGDSKKSCWVPYAHYHNIAYPLQYYPDYLKFTQDAYGFPHKKAYAINIVRAVDGNDPKQRHEFGMFLGAVEQLKDGFFAPYMPWRSNHLLATEVHAAIQPHQKIKLHTIQTLLAGWKQL